MLIHVYTVSETIKGKFCKIIFNGFNNSLLFLFSSNKKKEDLIIYNCKLGML